MSSRAGISANGGYTLVEVLAYATILVVIANFSSSVVLSSKRLHTLGNLAIERNEALDEIGRDFREIVHGSHAILGDVSGVPSTGGSLLLEYAEREAAIYSLWRCDDDGRLYLEQYERRDGGRAVLCRRKAYPECVSVTRLDVTADEPSVGALVRLVLTVSTEGTPRTVPRENQFVARLADP